MIDKEINATIEANPIAIENNHMVGIKDSDGTIHVIKCFNDPKVVGKTILRKEWDSYKVTGVPDDKYRRALLHPRNEDGSVHMRGSAE